MTIHLPAVGPDLPVHPTARDPRTGVPLRAVGWWRGRPMWPVMGASPDDPNDGDGNSGHGDAGGSGGGDDGDGSDDGDDGDGQLGDAGKKALDAMKGQRNKARADLRPWAALARELGLKTPEEVKALLAKKAGKAGGDADGDGQADADEIRRQARAEVERETLRDRVLDKIEVKARGFADPADAAALLLRERDVDDFVNGTRIDGDAIAEALAELLESKPYLAAQGGNGNGRKGPKPDPAQGPRPREKDKVTSLDSGRSLYAQRHKKTTTTST